ncbi:hypothetical protein FQN60_008217 [Etheostoma spectabile]|uniref:Phosducin domain-containing protein n=1 Tax=Etheostoma spectabile TaxID=54343 RepID=A0A5J5CQR6_9PERO|nr:hypothetical protein FQN60_008217 [Etheostoma spectabile]
MLQEEEDDEDFLQHYRLQRIEEMRRQLCHGKRFAQVYELNSGEDFLEALDREDQSILVMIHIYEPDVPGCEAMRGSLMCLAQEYPLVKFCSVRSSAISTSALFKESALPALLVYKGGDLIGNFVRVTDQLGEDFFAVDLEALLQEYGLLPDKARIVPKTVRNGAIVQNNHDDDSLAIGSWLHTYSLLVHQTIEAERVPGLQVCPFLLMRKLEQFLMTIHCKWDDMMNLHQTGHMGGLPK